MMTAEQASAALHKLMHSPETEWWYAFAMGAGCTTETGHDEILQSIRNQDARLRAILSEHRGIA